MGDIYNAGQDNRKTAAAQYRPPVHVSMGLGAVGEGTSAFNKQVERPTVTSAAERLANALTDASEAVSILTVRLSPLLAEVGPPTETDPTVAPTCGIASTVASLHYQIDRVNALTRAVQFLANSVDL